MKNHSKILFVKITTSLDGDVVSSNENELFEFLNKGYKIKNSSFLIEDGTLKREDTILYDKLINIEFQFEEEITISRVCIEKGQKFNNEKLKIFESENGDINYSMDGKGIINEIFVKSNKATLRPHVNIFSVYPVQSHEDLPVKDKIIKYTLEKENLPSNLISL